MGNQDNKSCEHRKMCFPFKFFRIAPGWPNDWEKHQLRQILNDHETVKLQLSSQLYRPWLLSCVNARTSSIHGNLVLFSIYLYQPGREGISGINLGWTRGGWMAPFIVSFSDPKGSTDNQFLQYLPVCKATFLFLLLWSCTIKCDSFDIVGFVILSSSFETWQLSPTKMVACFPATLFFSVF